MATLSLEESTIICLINANRLTEAERVIESCPMNSDGRHAYLLGVIYAKQDDYENAANEFQKIPTDSPYYARVNPFLERLQTAESEPYSLLSSDRREDAAQTWEEALMQNPDDLVIWHNLAVFYYWQAKHLEDQEAFAATKPNWRKAIGYWAAILASDRFWLEWAKQRAAACGIQESDITEVESGFMTYLLKHRLSQASEPERVESYLSYVTKVRDSVERQFRNHFAEKAGHSEKEVAEIYQALLLAWHHEWNVASLLERVKKIHRIVEHTNPNGLPPQMEARPSEILEYQHYDSTVHLNTIAQKLSIELEASVDVPSCGPIMLEILNRREDAQNFVNTTLETESTDATIAKLKRSFALTFTRLTFYLSAELGPWLVMVDVEMFDKAIQGIKEKLQQERPRDPLGRDLRLILGMACYRKGQSVLNDPEKTDEKYADAIEALENANLYAPDVMTDSTPFDFEIPRLIDALCMSISESVDRGTVFIDEGINLLQRLCQITALGRDVTCRRALDALLN
jgi:tetratricopeptide (TPR) repeat protein